MSEQWDAIVVGAGAAGMVCAATAAARGRRVLLLEKNQRPGRKLLVTGKGRCNVTNNCDRDEFLASVRSGNKFLYGALSAFSPQDTIKLFEQYGTPLKTERGNRVFPVSDKAMDVSDALVRMVRKSGAQLRTGTCAQVVIQSGAVVGVKTQQGEIYWADKVVLATGGLSYPLTGSTGDGYRFAQEAGHTLATLRPSLVPIQLAEQWCRDVMGLSLRNVALHVTDLAGKSMFRQQGEMLFTHFGVSGPLVLSASACMRQTADQYRIAVDLKPALSFEQLDARILRDFSEYANKDFYNSLDSLLPRKLIPVVVALSGIGHQTKVHQITREQRHRLVGLCKALPLTPTSFRPAEEAVVTAGGVSLKEISPKTMESKLVSGLYFAGEVADLDAYTGGFNLQIAFSTGYLAGQNI